MGWLSGPPAPPDYAGAAQAQGAANLDAARVQGQLNNPNIIGPYGSQIVGFDGDHPTVYQSLSDPEQSKFNLTEFGQNSTLQAMDDYGVPAVQRSLQSSYTLPGQAASDYDQRYTPLDNQGRPDQTLLQADMSGVAPRQNDVNLTGVAMPGTGEAARKQVQDAMYARQTAMLDPQYGQEESALESQLANQGITRGSAAYQTAQDNFQRQKQQAYAQARDQAITGGEAAQQQQYNQGLQSHQTQTGDILNQGTFHNQGVNDAGTFALGKQTTTNNALGQQYGIANNQAALSNSGRAQNLQELISSHTLPINIINSLMSGSQVNTPTFQPFQGSQVAPAPIFDGALAQGQAQIGSYNGQQAGLGNWLNAGSNLAGAAIKWSDRRLKTNIKLLGKRGPHNWYSYNINGRHEQGVMAQEVEHVPGAVLQQPDGYLAVDYSKLGI